MLVVFCFGVVFFGFGDFGFVLLFYFVFFSVVSLIVGLYLVGDGDVVVGGGMFDGCGEVVGLNVWVGGWKLF